MPEFIPRGRVSVVTDSLKEVLSGRIESLNSFRQYKRRVHVHLSAANV